MPQQHPLTRDVCPIDPYRSARNNAQFTTLDYSVVECKKSPVTTRVPKKFKLDSAVEMQLSNVIDSNPSVFQRGNQRSIIHFRKKEEVTYIERNKKGNLEENIDTRCNANTNTNAAGVYSSRPPLCLLRLCGFSLLQFIYTILMRKEEPELLIC